jgi:hypothetical protein
MPLLRLVPCARFTRLAGAEEEKEIEPDDVSGSDALLVRYLCSFYYSVGVASASLEQYCSWLDALTQQTM